MLAAIQQALGDKTGALVLVISLIILSIAGSYRLFDARLEKIEDNEIQSLKSRYDLSERITKLETIHEAHDGTD